MFYYSIDEFPARSSARAIRTPIQATAASISTDVFDVLRPSSGDTSHLIEECFTPCEIVSSSPLSSCRSISPVNQPACLWLGCRPRCGDLRVKLTPRAPSGSQKRGRSTAHPLSTRFFKQTLFFGCVTHGRTGPPLEGENRGAENTEPQH